MNEKQSAVAKEVEDNDRLSAAETSQKLRLTLKNQISKSESFVLEDDLLAVRLKGTQINAEFLSQYNSLKISQAMFQAANEEVINRLNMVCAIRMIISTVSHSLISISGSINGLMRIQMRSLNSSIRTL